MDGRKLGVRSGPDVRCVESTDEPASGPAPAHLVDGVLATQVVDADLYVTSHSVNSHV